MARWPASSSAWVTIPTGFVKSTIQASGATARRDVLGQVEDDRHGPERLGEAARSGGLLADAAEPVGQRLVGEPGRLPADPELDEDERRAGDGARPGRSC